MGLGGVHPAALLPARSGRPWEQGARSRPPVSAVGSRGSSVPEPRLIASIACGCVRVIIPQKPYGEADLLSPRWFEAAHGFETAALLKFGHDIGEHRVKHERFDGIEFSADLTVAGDLAHAEQCFAV